MSKPVAARHHAFHPPSVVSPNLAVNQKPNPAPVARAAEPAPNPNPSLGTVGVDAVNARLGKVPYPLLDVPAELADDNDGATEVGDEENSLKL
jgi:hypothetical protein